MSKRHLHLSWIVALVALVAALVQPPEARADDAAKARQLFQRGKRHYGERDYVVALQHLKQALALVQRSSVVLMVARCYHKLDRPDRALQSFEQYQTLWRKAHPGKPSPHRGEVRSQLKALRTVVNLVRQGEQLHAQPRAALALYKTALGLSPWARIYRNMAQCQLALGQPELARSSVKAAVGYWERYRIRWTSRHPGRPPPDQQELQRALASLKQLEQRIQRQPHAAPRPAPPAVAQVRVAPAVRAGVVHPAPSPAPRDTPRSTLWLALGITTAALAVGAETWAWVSYAEATNYHDNQPEYGTFRSMTVAGHVVAGVMAVGSGVSFYLWYRSGKRQHAARPLGLALVPGPGGWVAVGRLRF